MRPRLKSRLQDFFKIYPQLKAQEIASRLASKPPLALKYMMDCVWQAGCLTLEQCLDMEAKCYSLCCTSPEVIRGLEDFLEKRRQR